MKSLHTLEGFVLEDHDLKIIRSLGELRHLKKLTLFIVGYPLKNIDAIVSSLGKLRNLRHLEVGYGTSGYSIYDGDNRLGLLFNPPIHLEKLLLMAWKLPRAPRWINGNLKNLCRLSLGLEETSTEELRVLGEMPSLVVLKLCMSDKPYWRRHRAVIVFSTRSFPALENLDIHYGNDATSLVRFEAPGVLPNLRSLTLRLWALDWGGAEPAGMEHLLKLRNIHLMEHYWEDDESADDSEMVSFFKNYAAPHRCTQAIRPFPPTVTRIIGGGS